MGLIDIFSSAHDDVPLNEREILEIAPSRWFDDDLPSGYESRVVNFNTYLDDGRPPQISGLELQDQYIDWDSDDSFTRALETIKSDTFERIENSPELQELLAKEPWGREDRVAWERGVSEIVSDEHAKIDGLGEYRNVSDSDRYPDVEKRVSRLNDLSDDIDNNTAFIEHDCETHSIVEGVILQQVDNHFLPETSEADDYRVASNYFYAVGRTNFNPEYNGNGSHAYIVSSATTNVIEATARSGAPYNENVNPEMSFEDFILGDMIVNTDGSIYTGYHHSVEDITRYRFDSGEISADRIYEQIPNREEITDGRYNDAPPEAQILIEMKSAITELEILRDEGCVIDGGDINDIIAERRQEFDQMIEDLVDEANIQDAMKFARTVKRGDGTYVADEVRLEAAYDKVQEMNPDWTEDQVEYFVFLLEIGTVPDVNGRSFQGDSLFTYYGGSSEGYEEFRHAKIQEIMNDRGLGIDQDEARSIWNTQEAQQAIRSMNDGEISRAEIMEHPEYSQALILHEIAREVRREFPRPGTAGAYAKTDERLDAFEREYDEFTGERETCESLSADHNASGILSAILPKI